MAEATEEIVKIYLEQKGYLVTLSKRINVKTNTNSPRTELDIVAILTNDEKSHSNLPKRIVGEVKSYGINPRSFEKLDKTLRERYGYKSRTDYDRFKWVNKDDYRREILKALKEEYGYKDFKFVLFCSGVNKKYSKEIIKFLNEKEIKIVTHLEILKSLFENISNEYTNDKIIQLLRIIKKNAKIKFKQ